ncbi:TRAP transporter small permease [Arenimonas sp. MALMAid1274]|uniref:TRAP transporter small permease n=1 Tax=Arenimonas sp. MALMAid1274 TaxID=3411630 RepID=UPI003B9F7F1B
MSDASTAPDPAPGPLDRLAKLAIVIAAAALVGLVAVQGWQVFARYVINDSPSWTEPVTLLLLSTAMSLAAAAGVHTQRHFRFNLLADAAGPRAQRALAAASELVVVLIGGFLAVGAARLWLDGLDVRMAGAPMPQSIAYLPLALGGALMVVFGFARLAAALRPAPGGEG